MEIKKVCAVIVTFNRSTLLLRAIDAVIKQSHKVNALLIIDNASTDNTKDNLMEKFNFSGELNDEVKQQLNPSQNIPVYYYRKKSNERGAGGFYTGLKLAHEMNEFNYFWLMDDDGYPSENCLKEQWKYVEQYDYIMPLSVDIDNYTQLSWATKKRNGEKTIIVKELKNDWGEIMPFIFPFNGSLLSKKIVDEVGYINPKLFIWGDDYEHYYRCLKNGFKPITVLDAIFYHPVNKAPTVPVMKGLFKVPYVDSELRFVCLIRNWAYINKTNHRYLSLLKSFGAYSWLFLITKHFDFKKYKLFLASYFDGLTNNFERHKKYLPK